MRRVVLKLLATLKYFNKQQQRHTLLPSSYFPITSVFDLFEQTFSSFPPIRDIRPRLPVCVPSRREGQENRHDVWRTSTRRSSS